MSCASDTRTGISLWPVRRGCLLVVLQHVDLLLPQLSQDEVVQRRPMQLHRRYDAADADAGDPLAVPADLHPPVLVRVAALPEVQPVPYGGLPTEAFQLLLSQRVRICHVLAHVREQRRVVGVEVREDGREGDVGEEGGGGEGTFEERGDGRVAHAVGDVEQLHHLGPLPGKGLEDDSVEDDEPLPGGEAHRPELLAGGVGS